MTIAPVKPWTHTESLHQVAEEIERFFLSKVSNADRYGSHYRDLWERAATHTRGGKMMRPWLALAAFDALAPKARSKEASAAVVTTAVAVELLHYAFVLHDDVLDADTLRRGSLNLIGSLEKQAIGKLKNHSTGGAAAAHWGNTGAILMGDLLLAKVHQDFARVVLSSHADERLLTLLEHVIEESVAGEWADVGLSHGLVTGSLVTILDMSANKTATYSCELPLRAAAILAGAPRSVEVALGQAGRSLGLAFQLHDDLLTAFGDPAEHGKDPLSDFREGKQTPLIAYAMMTSAWKRIAPLFGKPDLTVAEGLRVREMLDSSGAKDFVQGLIHEQLSEMRSTLAHAQPLVPLAAANVLEEVALRLEGEQS